MTVTVAVTSTTRVLRFAGPAACACAVAFGAIYLRGHDPAAASTWTLPCPLFVTTGLYCPGCGITRATHSLLNGRIGEALGYNLLLPVFIILACAAMLNWLRVATHRPLPSRLGPVPLNVALSARASIAVGALLLLFAVARNLSPFAALAP